MPQQPIETDALLTPAEVAAILYVDPKTVTRWAQAGKISYIRTPGGHRRFLCSEILALSTAARSPGRPPLSYPSRPDLPAADARLGTQPDRTPHPSVEAGERAAAVVVARAVALAREAQAAEAALAVVSTRFAVGSAASIAANAAETARVRRAAAAADAADAVASSARRTAATVQRRADASAATVREAATQAATVVLQAGPPGDDRHAALAALEVSAAVRAAAVVVAEQVAEAAAGVATAVTAAAAEVAHQVADWDVAVEAEVAAVAAAVQATATAAARDLAAATETRADEVASVAREAMASMGSFDGQGGGRRSAGPATTVGMTAPTVLARLGS